MQDVSQKTMFDEVYKNQMKIIEDKEKESREKKHDDLKFKYQELQDRILAEEMKRAEANSKNAKYQEDFLKVQEKCNVKEISDLVVYYQE